MRSLENNVLTADSRVPSLRTYGWTSLGRAQRVSQPSTHQYTVELFNIIVDDFDSSNKEPKRQNSHSTGPTPRIYTRSYSDASIKKMLEEAEHRKHEFWKLLDEHNAVIENLKRIEKLEHKII